MNASDQFGWLISQRRVNGIHEVARRRAGATDRMFLCKHGKDFIELVISYRFFRCMPNIKPLFILHVPMEEVN